MALTVIVVALAVISMVIMIAVATVYSAHMISRLLSWVRRQRWLIDRRWALLLLPMSVLVAFRFGWFPWTVLLAIMLVVFKPELAARLVPWGLLGYGAAGFLLTANGWQGGHYDYGLAPGLDITAFRLMLPEAVLFLVAGGWLLLRLNAAGARIVRALVQEKSWGLLLLPVLAMIMELVGLHDWFGVVLWPGPYSVAVDVAILAAAFVVIFRRPQLAASAALVGMVFLGAYGIMLAAFWPSVSGGFFGAMLVDDKNTAVVGGGVQGIALLVAASRLAPRIYRSAPDPELAAKAKQLSERVQTLTQTRTDAVDTAVAELRRIERDLHDGAQARLVAVGMSLQAAERLFRSSPDAALALISEAKQTSSRALTELRSLVRGIYPPVLADRGLADAVRALALDTPLHTIVDIDLPGEVEMPVGSAVYFAIAEMLANAARHSGARTVGIQISHGAGNLRAQVTDDGAGGADPEQGTGLHGVERRLATFDGILAVSSPPGGPTIVVIEVPCELSLPKTSSC